MDALTGAQEQEAVRLMDAAFAGDFDETDWAHALGGTHAVAFGDGRMVGHASVVPRDLWADDTHLASGYVEAVAVLPELQGLGIGSELMRSLEAVLDGTELGVLGTDSHRFYERLGWERWRGTTWVRTESALVRTADEDDGIMIRRTALTPDFAPDARLICLPREGDDW